MELLGRELAFLWGISVLLIVSCTHLPTALLGPVPASVPSHSSPTVSALLGSYYRPSPARTH